jgi:hypothetical protein
MENNNITDKGAKKIAASLLNNKKLYELSLNGNLITNIGAFAFAFILDSNCTLAALWLANRQEEVSSKRGRDSQQNEKEIERYTDEVAIKFAEVLTRNKSLCLLDLSHGRISNGGGKRFLKYIENESVPILNENTTMRYLYLNGLALGDQIYTDLINATAVNVHRFWKLCYEIRGGKISTQDTKELDALIPALRRDKKYHDVLETICKFKNDKTADANKLLNGAPLLAFNMIILALSTSYLTIGALVIFDVVVGYKINALPQSLHSFIDGKLGERFTDKVANSTNVALEVNR